MSELEGQMSIFDLGLPSGRTCPERSAATRERTSKPFYKPSQVSVKTEFQFLNLKSGGVLGASWETVGVLPGGSMTLNTGECPSVVRESTLSQILQANAPEKYYLSARACEGILRRAERRGKVLPPMLKEALEETVSLSRNEPESLGGGKGILPAVGRAFTLATNVDQSVVYEPKSLMEENWAESTVKNALRANASKSGYCIVQDNVKRHNPLDCQGWAVCVGNGQLHQTNLGVVSGALNCMHDQQAVVTNGKPPRKYIVRRLTPTECARLQGFPDWWTEGLGGSDSAIYKAYGNGLALPCAYDVLRRIAKEANSE